MNKTSIRLLNSICAGKSNPEELRAAGRVKPAHFSALMKDLLEQNYIVKKEGEFHPANSSKSALFVRIASRQDVEKILKDSNEQIFKEITSEKTIGEIQDLTGLSLRTVQRAIVDFESLGIIAKRQNKIKLQDDELILFARLLKTEDGSMSSEPHSEILFQDSMRTLKKTPKDQRAEGELTGFSLFSDYGIPYETIHDFYIEQKSFLKLEEVLIHSVLSSSKEQSKSQLAMSVLFYLKNKPKMDSLEIRRIAKIYSVTNIWLDIEAYIRNSDVVNPGLFLPKDEFREKAELYDVPPDSYVLPTAYPKLFEDIGRKLDNPVDAYLFGGENMRRKNIKPRTKDCDILVTAENERQALIAALEKLGYKSLNKRCFMADDRRVDPFDILEHPARSRVDLFKTRISGKLALSSNMAKRAEVEDFGNLKLHSLCNEDLFLLKATTLREGDIQDLGLVVRSGDFDWDVVWDELVSQEADNRMNFSTAVLDSCDMLSEQVGIAPPFYKKLVKRALDNEIRTVVRDREIALEGLIELLKGGDITEKMIRNRVDYLQRTRHLRKTQKNGNVFLAAEPKISLNVYSKIPVDSNARMKKFIRTYVHQLGISDAAEKHALGLVDRATEHGFGEGRKPSGLAAAILYLSCVRHGEHATRQDIGNVSGLSGPSFASLYKVAKSITGGRLTNN